MTHHTIRTLAAAGALALGSLATPAAADLGLATALTTYRAAQAPIAYVHAAGYGRDRRFQLIVTKAGAEPRVVVESAEPLMAPAWSPDGRQLAYVGYSRGNSGIYVRDLERGLSRRLVQEKGINGAPAWSPDGRSLAVSLSFGHNPDIHVVDVASGALRRLTEHAGIDTEPAWSPDGSEIAFTSDRAGTPQIFTVDSRGGNARRLSLEGAQNFRASYSPDGRSLLMVNIQGGRCRIAMLDLVNGGFKLLSSGPGDESPSFSPDGALIVYSSRRGTELAVMTATGAPLVRLPQRGEVHEVAWSRHGG